MNQKRSSRNDRSPRAGQGKGGNRPAGARKSTSSAGPRSGSRKPTERASAPAGGKRTGPAAGPGRNSTAGPGRRPEGGPGRKTPAAPGRRTEGGPGKRPEGTAGDVRRKSPAAATGARPDRATSPSSPPRRPGVGSAPGARQSLPHRNVRVQTDTRQSRLFPRRPPHDFEPDYEPEVDGEVEVEVVIEDAIDMPPAARRVPATRPRTVSPHDEEEAGDEDRAEEDEDEDEGFDDEGEDYDEDEEEEDAEEDEDEDEGFDDEGEDYDEDEEDDEDDEAEDDEEADETALDLESLGGGDEAAPDAADQEGRIQGVPMVAIVGRPNVGKSAIFNRLIGDNVSIVEDQPGVTRDRIYGECSWNRRTFMLIDTGGMVLNDEQENLKQSILSHARQAVDEAAVVLFVVDATAGIHGLEYDIAELLRRSGRPVLLVANKVDSTKRELDVHEFYEFALGEPWAISAIHGLGTGDLLDEVVKLLPPSDDARAEEDVRLAIIGRPNVGKSSLLNALLNEDRVIVDSTPGTTRDAVDTVLKHGDRTYRVVDTAGMRRPSRVDDRVEYYSNVRSLRAIRTCDIALLLVDATEGVHQQDQRVAGHVQDAKRGIVVVVNKWDVIKARGPRAEEEARHALAENLAAEFNFMSYAPVVFISAREKQGLEELFEVVDEVMHEYSRRIDTSPLNRVIQEALIMRPPPTFKGQQLRVYYSFQKTAKPPRFVLQVNSTKLLHFSYRRYLENHLRKAFGLMGTPIEIVLKK